MAEQNWSRILERILPSRRDAHLETMREILAELRRLGWSDRELFGIEMALEESLTNAIRHGNQFDESKEVQVCCKFNAGHFWLKVEDEGPGFVPDEVPDCTDDDNLEECGGRGLMLIRAYMTRVEYCGRGNCVVMEKIRGDADSSLVDVAS
jgi:serine/threonine-protein kinase RsbW